LLPAIQLGEKAECCDKHLASVRLFKNGKLRLTFNAVESADTIRELLENQINSKNIA
jgi:hypothetical protein